MAHKGTPGPWAPFRDMIGSKEWNRSRQPYERFWCEGLGITCDVGIETWTYFQISDKVEFEPGLPYFSYTWHYPGIDTPHPFDLRCRFRWDDHGQIMLADIEVEGEGLLGAATFEWPDQSTLDNCQGTDYYTAKTRPGHFTTNPSLLAWGPDNVPNSTGIRIRPVTWAETP